MEEQRSRGRPRKYLYKETWDSWYEKEWKPIAYNDLPHMKTDIAWIKWLVRGLFLIGLTLVGFQIWG